MLKSNCQLEDYFAPPLVDTIAINRQIADKCIQKKGYPFKII